MHTVNKQEFEMGFETKVMKVVKEVLGNDFVNGFCYGTLYVNCELAEARALKRRLTREFPCDVRMTAQGGPLEYAFDFAVKS
jgi:hypothetical protein